MHVVKIYQFSLYDVITDTVRLSQRWGTREHIEMIGGSIIESSAILVDSTCLVSDLDGLTKIGFDPSTTVK
jgi:hypothetical protein